MSFDEEPNDVHGECAREIAELQGARDYLRRRIVDAEHLLHRWTRQNHGSELALVGDTIGFLTGALRERDERAKTDKMGWPVSNSGLPCSTCGGPGFYGVGREGEPPIANVACPDCELGAAFERGAKANRAHGAKAER
jgi:hypothetical protein